MRPGVQNFFPKIYHLTFPLPHAGRGKYKDQAARDAKKAAARRLRSDGTKLRIIAQRLNVPKSTIQNWCARKD